MLYNVTTQALQCEQQEVCIIFIGKWNGAYNRIAGAILTIAIFPKWFRIMDSEPEHSKEIRPMLVDNYSVFFVIQDDKVIVTDVLYSASDRERRLKE